MAYGHQETHEASLNMLIDQVRQHLIAALTQHRDNPGLVDWYTEGLRLVKPLHKWATADVDYWEESRSQKAE